MKMFNSRSTIFVGLGSAALMLAAIGCGSSSSPSDGGTGGTSAGGGSGGTSAAGGSGGAAAPALSFTFDSSVQNWAINTYHDTNSTNLGFELAPDAGIDASTVPTLTHDTTDGSPATPAGCLKLTATFTGYNQYIDVKVGISPTVDLSGKKMHAQVQLASATGGTFPGGAILETDSTQAYTYGGSTGAQLTAGTWTPLVLDLDTVSTTGYDDTMVIQVGVQFYSGSAPTDGGTTLGPIEATFLIDTVQAL
ncbi:MAG TPA: hypothetical protein VFG23_15005 [Polyangia bacterium]|nr:hypothetical protein [Polyangia bacterium]